MIHKFPFLISWCVMCISCATTSHQNSALYGLIKQQNCEAASEKIVLGQNPAGSFSVPHDQNHQNDQNGIQTIGTTAASWGVTGAGYTADFLIVFVGGTVVTLGICSPIIALETSIDSNGQLSANCMSSVYEKLYEDYDSIGDKAYSNTRHWRKSYDTTMISRDIRAVAQCYLQRSQSGDIEKAYVQLNHLRSGPIYQHSDRIERVEVDNLYLTVTTRMQAWQSQTGSKAANSKNSSQGGGSSSKSTVDELNTLIVTQTKAIAQEAQPISWRNMEHAEVWIFQKIMVKNAQQAHDVCNSLGEPQRRPDLPTKGQVTRILQLHSAKDFLTQLPEHFGFYDLARVNWQVDSQSSSLEPVTIDTPSPPTYLLCVL